MEDIFLNASQICFKRAAVLKYIWQRDERVAGVCIPLEYHSKLLTKVFPKTVSRKIVLLLIYLTLSKRFKLESRRNETL